MKNQLNSSAQGSVITNIQTNYAKKLDQMTT